MPSSVLPVQARLRKAKAESTPEAWLLELGKFPLGSAESAWLQRRLESLVSFARKGGAANIDAFLESNDLLQDDTFPRRLSQHMPKWRPRSGLGVWPARQAPRLPTKEDFETMATAGRGTQFRFTVVRVTAEPDARIEALRVMGDLGNVLLVAGRSDSEDYLAKTKQVLTERITEQAYLGAAFYVPLLDWASVEGAQTDELEQWLAGASLYVRESLEDNGVIVVSAEPLAGALESLGFEREAGNELTWVCRIES